MARAGNAPYDVNGRTVFITGAARGIGKASAERLYAKGANVALVGLEPERLEENAAALGERAMWFEVDVTDYDALQRAVAATVERFGRIDVAIANAGLAFVGALATEPVEYVERTLAVNLLGVWRTDRAVISQILENRGYLLNIASVSALTHAPLMGPYTASKAGVEALSDAWRMESAPFGAAIGCAYFGFIDTDLVKAAYTAHSTEALNQRSPAFIRNPIPLSRAIDAIERGIERRSARVWAPRYVGALLAIRGLFQPFTERTLLRDPAELREALRFADPASGEVPEQDPMLGIASAALTPPERTPISR